MISPNDTFTVYLDEDLPADQRAAEPKRPAAVYRYGTAAQQREQNAKLAAMLKDDACEVIDVQEARANYQLVETRNLGEPGQQLSEVLTESALAALAGVLREHRMLSGEVRKNFASPSHTVAAASAKDAPAGPATV